MQNFKKSRFWVIAIVVIMIVAVYMGIMRKPQTILLPEVDAVQSIEMEQFHEYSSLGSITVTDIESIEIVLSNLLGAKKTLRQSTNDHPIQSNYLILRLILEGERRTLCIYSDDGNYYIEEPYVGIYKSNKDISVEIYNIYNRGL